MMIALHLCQRTDGQSAPACAPASIMRATMASVTIATAGRAVAASCGPAMMVYGVFRVLTHLSCNLKPKGLVPVPTKKKKALPGAGWPSARSWHTAQQRADKDVACTRRYAHLGPDRLHGGACLPRRGARARPRARRRPVLGTAELCAACYPPRSRGRRFYPAAGLVARGQRSSGQAAARRRPGARRVCAALERRHPWCRAEPRGVVGQGLRSRRRAAAARTPRARARRWGLGQGRRRGAAPIASLVRAPIGCCAHRAWSRCPPPQGLATPWAGAGHRDDDDAGRTEHYPGGCLFILGEPMPHTFSAHLQPRPDPFSSQLCAARGVFWAASL